MGWIVAAVVILLFGKTAITNLNLGAILTPNPTPVAPSALATSGAANPVAPPTTGNAASQVVQNQVPSPYGQPPVVIQNQQALNTSNAPPPWTPGATSCNFPKGLVIQGGAVFVPKMSPGPGGPVSGSAPSSKLAVHGNVRMYVPARV